MATGMPELGSRISLISRADIRYEGKLYTVDPIDCTISLSSVRSLGTEDRNVEKPVPAQSLIYDYILFRAADIKDIKVLSPTMPDDPAIVQMATSSTLNPYQHPLGGFPQSYMPQLAPGGPLQGWLSGQQPSMFPPQAPFSQTQFVNMGSAATNGNQSKNQSEWKDKVNDFQDKPPFPPSHYLPQDGAFLEMEDANIDKTPVLTPTYNQMRHGPMDIFPKASFSTSANNESLATSGEKTFGSLFDMLDEQKVSSGQKSNVESGQLFEGTGSSAFVSVGSSEKGKDRSAADPKTSLKSLFGSTGQAGVSWADRVGVRAEDDSASGAPNDLLEMDPERAARSSQFRGFSEGPEKERKFGNARRLKAQGGQDMNLPGASNEFGNIGGHVEDGRSADSHRYNKHGGQELNSVGASTVHQGGNEGVEDERRPADFRRYNKQRGQEMNFEGGNSEYRRSGGGFHGHNNENVGFARGGRGYYRGMGGNFRGQNHFGRGGVGGEWPRPSRNWEQGNSGWYGGNEHFLSHQQRWRNNQEWHRQDGRNSQGFAGARFRGHYNHFNHQNRFPSFLPQFQNIGKTQIKFDHEYDFEEANTHFEELKTQISKMKIGDGKADDTKKPSGSGAEEEEATGSKAYDKKTSFFDTISCEAEEKNNPKDVRVSKVSERQLNTETFGVPTAPRTYMGGYGSGMPPHRFGRGMARGMGRNMGEGRGGYRNFIPSHYAPRKNYGNAKNNEQEGQLSKSKPSKGTGETN